MCRNNMCCLQITLAAKLVGFVGLMLSLIVTCQLISELTHHEGRGEIAFLLGIDIDEFDTSGDNSTNFNSSSNSTMGDVKEMMKLNYFMIICCLFAAVQVVSNSLLIWATNVERRLCTLPWFLCEAVSIIVQIVGFAYYITHKENEMEFGVLFTALIQIVVSIYFWSIVFRAQERWRKDYIDGDIPNLGEKPKTDRLQLQKKTCPPPPPPPPPMIIVTSDEGCHIE